MPRPRAVNVDWLARKLAGTEASLGVIFQRLRQVEDKRLLRIIQARSSSPKASFRELGEELGIGKERVRQLEVKAFRILRQPEQFTPCGKHLPPFG